MSLRRLLSTAIGEHGYIVREASEIDDVVGERDIEKCAVAVLAIGPGEFPDICSLDRLTRHCPKSTVLLIGGSDSERIAAARQIGCEHLPFRGDHAPLHDFLHRQRRRLGWDGPIEERATDSNEVMDDPLTAAVFAQADRAARVDSTVLITGETGTGKEVLARRIHRNSPRYRAKFVPINCGALPDNLVETEFFGYRKGAFTGAVANVRGLIEEAEHGVLFLDEIGEMPLPMQVSLLRFLDSGEVRPVGASSARRVDVRVLAATNRCLEDEVRRGNFRQDLFFRVNVVALRLPPLRDRKQSIPSLVERGLSRIAAKLKVPVPTVSREALKHLVEYAWPGNIRELQNALEQAIVQSTSSVILPEDLPPHILRVKSTHTAITEGDGHLMTALAAHNGNHREAAAALGMSRTTLWRRLRRHQRNATAKRHQDVSFALASKVNS